MRRTVVGVGIVAALGFAIWHYGCRTPAKPTTATTSKQVVRGHRHTRLPTIASIAGTVTTDTGAPIPHARVCARPWSDAVPTSVLVHPYCAIADERGAYVIAELFAAEYQVAAMSPRYPAVELEIFMLRDSEQRTGVDIVLKSGGVEVTGTVLDQSGGPIAHAWVSGYSLDTKWSTPVVDTDDHGAFELWMWPGSIEVGANADGYAYAQEHGLAPGHFALELTRSSSIAGVVIDGHTHLPVAGAKVHAEFTLFDVTDDQGRFLIDGIEPGRYPLTVTAPHGYGRSDGSVLAGLAQHVDGVTISLYPAARIEGSVVIDDAVRTPCAKPDVALRLDGPEIDATNDPAGAVHFDAVPPGTYPVDVRCHGFIAVDDSIKLVVSDRDIVGQLWRVQRGGTIRGHVRDASGAPVSGATVFVDGTEYGDVTAKADGSYEVDALRTGTHTITASSGGASATLIKAHVAAGSIVVQDLTLEPGTALAITVTDSDGAHVLTPWC